MKRLIPLALAACLVPLGADESKKERTHTVDVGTIPVCAEATGPLSAAEKAEVRLKPEKYADALTAVEVVPSGRVVKKGEVLLRIDRKKYDEAVKDSTEALDDAEKELAFEKIEDDLTEKKAAIAYEAAQMSNDESQHDLDAWLKARAHQMLRGEELQTLRSQYGRDDEAQELSQLEGMYKKSELATETKEIVLDRARRNIRITDEYLEMQKREEECVKAWDFPDRDRRVKTQARHNAADFEMEKVSRSTEAEKRRHALDKAERGLKKSREDNEKLVKDAALFEVVAPCDGVLSHEIEKHGAVPTDKPALEVWTPDKYQVELSAGEADAVLVSVGARADVFVAAAPMAQLKGMVTEASLVGKGDDPKYPFKVAVEGSSAELRFGMKAKVSIWGPEQKDALWVPRAAVTTKDGKSTVKVKLPQPAAAENAIETRTIVLGPGNPDQVVVLKGLTKGEVVTWEEE